MTVRGKHCGDKATLRKATTNLLGRQTIIFLCNYAFLTLHRNQSMIMFSNKYQHIRGTGWNRN